MIYIKKKNILIALILTVSLFFSYNSSILFGKETSIKKKRKNLEEQYKLWLDLTKYIIKPLEKKNFFLLTNNIQRNEFINLFWKMRDPTKGTPANEYKTEHIKRFQYANRYYKYDSPRAGWRNDRGRIHIILGPPVNRNEIVQNELRPIDIWEYFGDPKKGLPTMFRVVFYKKSVGSGYRLYIPIQDGPAALLTTIGQKLDVSDRFAVLKKIQELEPAVAEIALTLVPGEQIYDGSPSMRDPMLMSNIYELPKRSIDASYATNFLNFRGIVNVLQSTEFIKSTNDVYIFRNPILGINFVHFVIRPTKISADYSEETDKYYFNFNLTVQLKKGKKKVFEYKKNFPYYFSKEELDARVSHGIIIADYFPVIEGDFKLVAIIQNSIKNEIASFEKTIKSSEYNTSVPNIYGPIVSYSTLVNHQTGFSAFNLMGYQTEADPKNTFGLKDQLTTTFFVDRGNNKGKVKVKLLIDSIDERRQYKKEYTYDLSLQSKFSPFTQKLEKLKYGNYTLKVKVIDENKSVLVSRKKSFIVSPLPHIAHPPMITKFTKDKNSFLFYMMLANQYQNEKKIKKAELFFEKAIKLNNSYPPLVKLYGTFLLNQKKFKRLFNIIPSIKTQGKDLFTYYSLLGKAFFYLKNYNNAIDTLLKANKIYNSDVSILNTLGFSFIKMNMKNDALKVLQASIKIQHRQKNILKLINKLKNEK